MNIVRLCGGLGNQLFQYSFARYLEKQQGCRSFVFGGNSQSKELRSLVTDLQEPSFNEAEFIPAYWKDEKKWKHRIIRKLYQKFPILNNKVIVEDSLWYKEKFPKGAIAYDGYWQSYKYLMPIEEELRSKIMFTEKDIGNIPLYVKIKESNSVSIHIRRGDYLQGRNKDIFCNCDSSYYQAAIKTLLQKYKDLSFFIFSNDPLWVKTHFDTSQFKNNSFIFVLNSNTKNAILADMFLMSQCNHNIIANSTFSWWGAWLNKNPEKIIIAPKCWYLGKRNAFTNDLIPENWLRL